MTAGLCAMAAGHGRGAFAQHAVCHHKARAGPATMSRPRGVYGGGVFAGGPGAGARLQHGAEVARALVPTARMSLRTALGAQSLDDARVPKPPPWPSITTSFNSVSSFCLRVLVPRRPTSGAQTAAGTSAPAICTAARGRISSAVTSWHIGHGSARNLPSRRRTICPP